MVQGLRNPHALQGRKRQPFGGRWILENTGFSFRKLTRIRNSQPAMSIALLSFLKEATRIWRATMAPPARMRVAVDEPPERNEARVKGFENPPLPERSSNFYLEGLLDSQSVAPPKNAFSDHFAASLSVN